MKIDGRRRRPVRFTNWPAEALQKTFTFFAYDDRWSPEAASEFYELAGDGPPCEPVSFANRRGMALTAIRNFRKLTN